MLFVKIAKTRHELEKGLMFEKSLDSDEGMLFVFSQSKDLSFWGLNTYIPLDIAFLDKDKKIVDISHITPMSMKSVSCKNCKYALETNYGYFKENRISIGDKINIDKINDNENFAKISFDSLKIAQSFDDIEEEFNAIKNTEDTSNQINEIDYQMNENYKNEPTMLEVTKKDISEKYIEDDIEDDIIVNEGLLDEFQKGIEKEVNRPDRYEDKEEEYYNEDMDLYKFLDLSIKNKDVIKIDYTTKKGVFIQRTVEPHGSFLARTTGNLILVTYDRTSGVGDIRAFIVTNISKYDFDKNKFEPKFKVTQ